MKKMINEVKELNVEMKIAVTMLLGVIFSTSIQYLRGCYGLGIMILKIIAYIIFMFSVIMMFPGVNNQENNNH